MESRAKEAATQRRHCTGRRYHGRIKVRNMNADLLYSFVIVHLLCCTLLLLYTCSVVLFCYCTLALLCSFVFILQYSCVIVQYTLVLLYAFVNVNVLLNFKPIVNS